MANGERRILPSCPHVQRPTSNGHHGQINAGQRVTEMEDARRGLLEVREREGTLLSVTCTFQPRRAVSRGQVQLGKVGGQGGGRGDVGKC